MGKNGHTAIFGSIKMKRAYCEHCKGNALILDNKFSCCDRAYGGKVEGFSVVASNLNKRKTPTQKEKRRIKEVQGNRCLYCDKEYGTFYFYKNKVRRTKINYDHLVPFSYCRVNRINFVGSCNICNGIKGAKMFDTIEEVFRYVEQRRKEKGYEYYEDKENKDLPTLRKEVPTR